MARGALEVSGFGFNEMRGYSVLETSIVAVCLLGITVFGLTILHHCLCECFVAIACNSGCLCELARNEPFFLFRNFSVHGACAFLYAADDVACRHETVIKLLGDDRNFVWFGAVTALLFLVRPSRYL